MKKVVYLPLDERPCNYDYPYRLAKQAKGYRMVRPAFDIMGKKKTPAEFADIQAFLLKETKDADILVMAIDTLLYGGIVPSRSHHFSQKEVISRLEVIKEIKKANPNIKIYAFSLILRCPCYDTDDEEPTYYGKVGEAIWTLGVLQDKLKQNLITQAEFDAESPSLIQKTKDYLDDFLTRRVINREAILAFLDDYCSYVDFYVIPQDDSSPYGYTSMDRAIIRERITENKQNILLYPGADEVGMVLFARALSDSEGKHPTADVIYPKPECEDVIPMYEDRQIKKTLPMMLEACGYVENSIDRVSLFMNYPTKAVVNMGSAPGPDYKERDLPAFVDMIASSIKQKKITIVNDAAYGNGGEQLLLDEMQKRFSLYDIDAYAGWNTSSNALGTALAEGMMVYLFGESEANKKFLAERYYEDIGYCGGVRWGIWHDVVGQYGYNYDYVGGKNGIIAKLIKQAIIELFESKYPEIGKRYALAKCQIPWKRIFEVDITAKKAG